MVIRFSFFLFTFFSILPGCKKTDEKETAWQVNISYQVDSSPLQMNRMMYMCEAGYDYEVTKLNYYVSHFVFSKNDGSQYESDKVFYVNAANPTTNSLLFENFPPGDYTAVDFYVGLDSSHNVTDGLAATLDNINMGWPDEMGGGYHFMKLEGHYKDANGTYGFAIHLGKNKHLVPIHLSRALTVSGGHSSPLNLTMNINEWFKNPAVYDFNTDGNYSMNNDTAMQKLCINGADIFN